MSALEKTLVMAFSDNLKSTSKSAAAILAKRCAAPQRGKYGRSRSVHQKSIYPTDYKLHIAAIERLKAVEDTILDKPRQANFRAVNFCSTLMSMNTTQTGEKGCSSLSIFAQVLCRWE